MTRIVSWVSGLAFEDVANDTETFDWVFSFGRAVTLRVAAPWRIIADGKVALGRDDHGEQFGLSRPIDGVASAKGLLRGRVVASFSTSRVSADAVIDFGGGLQLEIFSSSSGYEGSILEERGGRALVAQGGGNLVEKPAGVR